MLNDEGYNVVITNLPYEIHGFTRSNEDDSYSIILNARDTHERRLKTYEHEVSHIINMDFLESDVQVIEYERHGLAYDEP